MTKTLDKTHPCYGNPNVLLRVDRVELDEKIVEVLLSEGITYIGELIAISQPGAHNAIFTPRVIERNWNTIETVVVGKLGLRFGVNNLPIECKEFKDIALFYGVSQEDAAFMESALVMYVALPNDLVEGKCSDFVVKEIKDTCQRAFNLAVENELQNTIPEFKVYDRTTPHLGSHISVFFRRLDPNIKSIKTNTGKPTTTFCVPLTSPFHEAVTYKPAFLKQVAEKISGEFLYSLLAPKLQG